MEQTHALKRLSHHANAAEGDSFTFALWQAARQSHQPELRKFFDDIMTCFDAINHALNTQHPSDTIDGKADALPRSLVADVCPSCPTVGVTIGDGYRVASSLRRFRLSSLPCLFRLASHGTAFWQATLTTSESLFRQSIQ